MSLTCHSEVDGSDDSGNSSSSNSSVILSLDALSAGDEAAAAESSASSASVQAGSSGLWQPDFDLYDCGYELADYTDSSDIRLPLHKTVCCALCRKKEARLKSLAVDDEQVDVTSPANDDVTQSMSAGANRTQSALRHGTRRLSDGLTLSRKDEKLMAALVANRRPDRHEVDCCRRAKGSRRVTSDHVTLQCTCVRCRPHLALDTTTTRSSVRHCRHSMQTESSPASDAECSYSYRRSHSATQADGSAERGRWSRDVNDMRQKEDEINERLDALRHDRHQQITQKARANDMQIRLTLEQAKEQERQALAALRALGEVIDANLSAAELKVRQKREEELARMRAELQRKIERSREKQRQMEDELRRWQQSLVDFIQQQDRNARSKVEAQLAKKREAAAKQREDRDRLHKENLHRMQEREREWIASIEASIESKDARSRSIQQQRAAARNRQARKSSRQVVRQD